MSNVSSEITILANPGHGNGPTVGLLMAAEALARQRAVGQVVNVIFPYTGTGQRGVIERRLDAKLKGHVNIYFDQTLGALIFPVTLRQNDYRQNVADIIAYQAAVQRLARRYIAAGLEAVDLAGTTRHFDARELTLELNHGSRIRMLDNAFSFFPCLLSDLLKRSDGITAEDRRQALHIVEPLEAGYRTIFLPRIHTFSWDAGWQPPANVTFTPFPRPIVTDIPQVASRGIYVVPSGVGTAGDPLIAQAAQALRAEILRVQGVELALYCPPGTPIARLPTAVELHPNGIAHANVEVVIGRAGWGTLWECLNASKLFLAIPALPGDDPEILFNLRTLEACGLGVVWQGQTGVYTLLQQTRARISETLAEIKSEFGTLNGLDVMARAIL